VIVGFCVVEVTAKLEKSGRIGEIWRGRNDG